MVSRVAQRGVRRGWRTCSVAPSEGTMNFDGAVPIISERRSTENLDRIANGLAWGN
jgi:hypothetical protein